MWCVKKYVFLSGAAAKTEGEVMSLVKCLHEFGRLICPVGPPEDLQWLTCFDNTPDGWVISS